MTGQVILAIARVLYDRLFRQSAVAVFCCVVAGVGGVTVGPSLYGWAANPHAVRVASEGEDCTPSSSTLYLDRETGEALICDGRRVPPPQPVPATELAPDFPYPDPAKSAILALAAEYAADGGLDEKDAERLRDYEVSIQYRSGRSDTIPNSIRLLSVIPLVLGGLAAPAVIRELWPRV